ncbi:hypothetical protein AB0M43_07165 [Longispora sp. NPDC051575]|uniref:hypothetical protein n=1 Tax=Longispora sp. NPDC051575 TaxID=3154943 RepID=UPI003447DA84
MSMSKLGLRGAVLAATATTFALLLGQAPAAAVHFEWAGAFSSPDQCEQYRSDAEAEGCLTGPCTYRDQPGTDWDGWYYRMSVTPA